MQADSFLSRPLVLVAACALVRPDYAAASGAAGEAAILLAQRPEGKNLAGFWEFPGGKIEQNERPEQALVRELQEELGLELAEADLQPLNFASHAYEKFHLLMPLYLCRAFSGQPQPREGQALQWVSAAALSADYRHYQQAGLTGAAIIAAGRPRGAKRETEQGNHIAAPAGVKFPLPPADIPLVPALIAALKS
ncbi:(deoxy)nucleoside triphosphate pyrophosphohydrolase [Candidatus Tokpelaia sp.]|uniref:(deoxy)nucleoside triphosphate pyrophosphohydrolase n=1 Tax=Candidatus Tokpelaia sp. TaxID=2233777 RepID=UPI00123B726B|nr:hypothetical protein DPQ22_05025 [Candidatus Tokpelaia sp.]